MPTYFFFCAVLAAQLTDQNSALMSRTTPFTFLWLLRIALISEKVCEAQGVHGSGQIGHFCASARSSSVIEVWILQLGSQRARTCAGIVRVGVDWSDEEVGAIKVSRYHWYNPVMGRATRGTAIAPSDGLPRRSDLADAQWRAPSLPEPMGCAPCLVGCQGKPGHPKRGDDRGDPRGEGANLGPWGRSARLRPLPRRRQRRQTFSGVFPPPPKTTR